MTFPAVRPRPCRVRLEPHHSPISGTTNGVTLNLLCFVIQSRHVGQLRRPRVGAARSPVSCRRAARPGPSPSCVNFPSAVLYITEFCTGSARYSSLGANRPSPSQSGRTAGPCRPAVGQQTPREHVHAGPDPISSVVLQSPLGAPAVREIVLCPVARSRRTCVYYVYGTPRVTPATRRDGFGPAWPRPTRTPRRRLYPNGTSRQDRVRTGRDDRAKWNAPQGIRTRSAEASRDLTSNPPGGRR